MILFMKTMDSFIHGDGHDRNERRSAQKFLAMLLECLWKI